MELIDSSMGIVESITPILVTVGSILLLSITIYLSIRFFAYKRSFPLPHQFDFLWIIASLLIIFLSISNMPPLDGSLDPTLYTWIFFFTYLLTCYLFIFVIDQFFVQYFLVSMLKVYVAPPLRRVILLFSFVVAVVVGIQKIFSINPWAVYAPTSVLSLGIGIALKDALQTFFAGVIISRIVHIGDWIRLGKMEGEVVNIHWARTVLRTWEGSHLFIPNSELQKQVFTNYSYHDKNQRSRLEVRASYDAPPQKVKTILEECAQNVDGVVATPPPEILLLHYADFYINYALTFWISDYSRYREISSEVASRIWYAFKRENIEIPYPIRTVHVSRKPKETDQKADPETMMSNIDLFKMMPTGDKQLILERLQKQVYLKGEVVVREGDLGSSFFIVLKGKLEVIKKSKSNRMALIGGLTAGQFFGELSLLTGEPRSATIRALEDSELLRLEKKDFQEVLEHHPSLAESLAEVVSSRQAVIEDQGDKEIVEAPVTGKKSRLSRKIKEFFNLKIQV